MRLPISRNQRSGHTAALRRQRPQVRILSGAPLETDRLWAVELECSHEVLRLVDSLQLTAQQPVATPVNWTQGDDVIIVPSVSDEQAREKFPGGWKAPKPYLRIVPQPHV
jgi:1-Cys peroxiredoxin